jgi:hypothetical protein
MSSSAFSIFIGLQSGSTAAERAYGSVNSFVSRRGMLEQAAEVYFRDHPDAKRQAVFDDILLAGGFSAHRNDIAHAKAMSFLRRRKVHISSLARLLQIQTKSIGGGPQNSSIIPRSFPASLALLRHCTKGARAYSAH